jgi:hypothetical protein
MMAFNSRRLATRRRSFADDHSSGTNRRGRATGNGSHINDGNSGGILSNILQYVSDNIPEQYRENFSHGLDLLYQVGKILGILLIFFCIASTISTILYLLIQFLTSAGTTTFTRVHLDFPVNTHSNTHSNNFNTHTFQTDIGQDGTHTVPFSNIGTLVQPAKGNITLGDYKDQWTYSEYSSFMPFKQKTFSNPLKLQTKYQIDIIVRVAKSPRNQAIGKVMIRMNLLAETTSEVIATSSRPLIVPFAPMMELTLRSMLLVVPRMVRSILKYHTTWVSESDWTDHYDTVVLNMFNDYEEVAVLGYRTKYIELIVSNPEIDILETLIRISDQGGAFSRQVTVIVTCLPVTNLPLSFSFSHL